MFFGTLFLVIMVTVQESDYTALHDIAIGMVKLQKLYGIIPKIIGKGAKAKVIKNQFFFAKV